MKIHEKEYQRIKQMEGEIILLLSKNMSDAVREKILELREHVGEVLSNIERASEKENIDDLLIFLFGYDFEGIALDCSKQIDEFKKMVKEE